MLKLKPTEEQEEIIRAMPTARLIKVNAFAGTGKTSTLQLLAARSPHLRFLYLVYNKSMQIAASRVLGTNVKVSTAHALAYKYVAKHTNLRLEHLVNYRATDFAEHLGLDYRLAEKVNKAFAAYCNSASAGVEDQPQHEHVSKFAQLVELGRVEPSHDFVLKKFQQLLLGGLRVAAYDVVLLDEAHDSTDVIIDIFMRLEARHKVLVGDRHQQIYSFRGTRNAMERVDGLELALTRTFRCSKQIADYSNKLLSRFKGERLVLRSQKESVSYQGAVRDPRRGIAFLSRGNAALIATMDELRGSGERFKSVRAPAEVFRLVKDVAFLLRQEKGRISPQNAFLADLADEEALLHYIESTSDRQLGSALRVYRTTFECDVERVLFLEGFAERHFRSKDVCRYSLSTAHAAKGLEFDCTVIADDFCPFSRAILDAGFHSYQAYFDSLATLNHPALDEFNLYYVALTRCRITADIQDGNINHIKDSDWVANIDAELRALRAEKGSTGTSAVNAKVLRPPEVDSESAMGDPTSMRRGKSGRQQRLSTTTRAKGRSMRNILDLRIDDVIYTVFDFETTGLGADSDDRVVEVAFCRYSSRQGVIAEFSSLVNPGMPIPAEATDVHGIRDEDVVHAPTFAELKANILGIMDGAVLVGHNVAFDLKFLRLEMGKLGLTLNQPYICTMYFAGYFGRKSKRRLWQLCAEWGIEQQNAHTAKGDVAATKDILAHYIAKGVDTGCVTFRDFFDQKITYKFTSSWELPLPNYASEYETEPLGVPLPRLLGGSGGQARSERQKKIRIHCDSDDRAIADLLCSLPSRVEDPETHDSVIPYRPDYVDFLGERFSDVAFLQVDKHSTEICVTLLPVSGSKPTSGCFVATAVYGNYDAVEVRVLRRFRDAVLMRLLLGRAFVRLYYALSPAVAQFLEHRRGLRGVTRSALDMLVWLVR